VSPRAIFLGPVRAFRVLTACYHTAPWTNVEPSRCGPEFPDIAIPSSVFELALIQNVDDETCVYEMAERFGLHWIRGRATKRSTLDPQELAAHFSLVRLRGSQKKMRGPRHWRTRGDLRPHAGSCRRPLRLVGQYHGNGGREPAPMLSGRSWRRSLLASVQDLTTRQCG